jgi:hypothetical protein
MTRLPANIDFDETAHPELSAIFRGIDAGIAAIVASDPAFRPKAAHKRRRPLGATTAPAKRQSSRPHRQAA